MSLKPSIHHPTQQMHFALSQQKTPQLLWRGDTSTVLEDTPARISVLYKVQGTDCLRRDYTGTICLLCPHLCPKFHSNTALSIVTISLQPLNSPKQSRSEESITTNQQWSSWAVGRIVFSTLYLSQLFCFITTQWTAELNQSLPHQEMLDD